MLRKWAGIIASVAMLMPCTMAFANDAHPAQQQGALAPGNAAGVEKATALNTNVLLIVVGVSLVAGGVALALSSSGGGGGSTTSTN
jgi:hypothetical protein